MCVCVTAPSPPRPCDRPVVFFSFYFASAETEKVAMAHAGGIEGGGESDLSKLFPHREEKSMLLGYIYYFFKRRS